MLTPSDEVIRILVKYVDVITAQTILEKQCDKLDISLREISFQFLPQVILMIANSRKDFGSVNDLQFKRLLRELTLLSNSRNPLITKQDIRTTKEQINKMSEKGA